MENTQTESCTAEEPQSSKRLVKFVEASDEQVRWGGNDDPRGLLVQDGVYEIARVEVHSWHTKYELAEFPGKVFNSVHFRRVE